METEIKNELEAYWTIFEYEVSMYLFTRQLLISNPPIIGNNQSLKNAVVESKMLHTRILVEILAPRNIREDDLTLKDLKIDFPVTVNIDELQNELKEAYGFAGDEDSPCWIINKKLAHPTKFRSDSFDYGAILNIIEPPLQRYLLTIGDYCGRPQLKELLDNYY